MIHSSLGTVEVPGRTSDPPIALVQLPFPSQEDPDPGLAAYYSLYSARYEQLSCGFVLGKGDLWEAPLWVAHLDGAIGRDDTCFVDLSLARFDPVLCADRIEAEAPSGACVFLSPLSQNFSLAVAVSHLLRARGHATVLGGNMARLARTSDFDVIYTGLARAGSYDEIQAGGRGLAGRAPVPGRRQEPSGYRPRYRLLKGFGRRVPLVRINASHGCLFGCTFCGDGWSRQLHVVPLEDLQAEFEEIEEVFPDARLVYVGDKTFGQSREAVENLIQVARQRPHPLRRFIVQTHVTMVDEWLLDALDRLGADVVEIGFETASVALLRSVAKAGTVEAYAAALESLQGRSKFAVLNVLGGLPHETRESHAQTVAFLRDTGSLVYLYNLYNFVPYPETPLFSILRERIVDWDFAHWREDRPVVFRPYHLSREEAWDQFREIVATCLEICANARETVPPLEPRRVRESA